MGLLKKLTGAFKGGKTKEQEYYENHRNNGFELIDGGANWRSSSGQIVANTFYSGTPIPGVPLPEPAPAAAPAATPAPAAAPAAPAAPTPPPAAPTRDTAAKNAEDSVALKKLRKARGYLDAIRTRPTGVLKEADTVTRTLGAVR